MYGFMTLSCNLPYHPLVYPNKKEVAILTLPVMVP